MARAPARSQARHQARFAAPLLLLAAIAVQVFEPGVLLEARLAVFDAYQRLAPRAYDDEARVRIVAIDDRAIAEVGQWPWPRSRLADLVAAIPDPAVIAFNIVFAEPDRASPARLAEELRDLPGVTLPDALPDNDTLFAEAIASRPVVLSFALTPRPTRAGPIGLTAPLRLGADAGRFAARFDGALPNLPGLDNAAVGQGAVNASPDGDGVVRRLPMFLAFGDELVLSLAAETYSRFQGGDTPTIRGVPGRRAVVRLGATEVETDAKGNVWSYFAPPDPRRAVSAAHVLAGTADATRLAGHQIIVGLTATGLEDQRATPLGNLVPGVEIHAQALEQLALGAFLVRPVWALAIEIVVAGLTGLALILLLPRLGPVPCAIGGLAAILATVAVSWLAFRQGGFLLDPVGPTLAMLLVYLAAALVAHLRTEAERAGIRNAFGRFVAPEVVDRLAADPARLGLGGEQRPLTIMFSDIRGFTGLSETLSPTDLTRLLNRFFTPMTDIVMAHQGTIDKFIGDSIMAFWNAPLDDPDHAAHACAAALAMRDALVRLNEALDAENRPPLAFGIGLNTGDALVGNMGSDQRLEYSALGDAVNLASRLEGQGKPFGVDIILSENTVAAAPGFAVLELDRVRVVGREQPVAIFALLGDQTTAATDSFGALATAHAAMLDAYRQRDWDAATDHLGTATAQPNATPLATYYADLAGRIAAFAANPPPAGWDGTMTATQK